MPKKPKLVQVFPPGDFLKEELTERGWSQTRFAQIIGRPLQLVNEIIGGKKRITEETAKAIGLALGTGPEFWLNLEQAYRLRVTPDPDPKIEERARKAMATAGSH